MSCSVQLLLTSFACDFSYANVLHMASGLITEATRDGESTVKGGSVLSLSLLLLGSHKPNGTTQVPNTHTVVAPYLQFHFSWFQFPVVNLSLKI